MDSFLVSGLFPIHLALFLSTWIIRGMFLSSIFDIMMFIQLDLNCIGVIWRNIVVWPFSIHDLGILFFRLGFLQIDCATIYGIEVFKQVLDLQLILVTSDLRLIEEFKWLYGWAHLGYHWSDCWLQKLVAQTWIWGL